MATPKLESNGKTWGVQAYYTDVSGGAHRKYKGGFPTAAKASKWAASYIAEGKDKVLVNQDLKLQQIMERLLHEKENIDKVSQSTMKFYEENFDIISSKLGNLRPQQLTAIRLQEFVNSFTATPRKCKAICQSLSLLYSYMERLDIVDRNLYKKIKVPEYQPKETKHYDLETYKLLLEKILEEDNCIYTPILLMGSLGLRPSETLPLTDKDIERQQDDYVLHIDKAGVTVKRKGKKEAFIVGETKTAKSKRDYPLDDAFVDKVYSYKHRHNIVSPYLCTNDKGGLMSYTVLAGNLRNIIGKYNLPPLSLYGLRHTFGQIQKSIGTDIYTISRIMGHSTIAITTKTYFHNDKELNKNAIKSLTSNL